MKELKIMKITKRYIMLICLLALASVVHAKAVSYQATYHPTTVQPAYGVASMESMPSVGFQSTSVYSPQWSAGQPMLNSDGSVNAEAYMGGVNNAPRKAPGGPGTPGGDLDPHAQQPLGDALLPLLLMALAFVAVRRYRRHKA